MKFANSYPSIWTMYLFYLAVVTLGRLMSSLNGLLKRIAMNVMIKIVIHTHIFVNVSLS